MANQLLEEEDKLKNLSSSAYLKIISAFGADQARTEGRANAFRQLTGRGGTFSLGSSGLAASLKSAMALRDAEIEAEVLRRQREAIADGTIKKLEFNKSLSKADKDKLLAKFPELEGKEVE